MKINWAIIGSIVITVAFIVQLATGTFWHWSRFHQIVLPLAVGICIGIAVRLHRRTAISSRQSPK